MTQRSNCKIDNCTNKYYTRGYCQPHYLKLLGTPELPRLSDRTRANSRPCPMPRCEEKQYAKGYCRSHYNLERKWGTPEGKPEPDHGTSARYSRGCRCEDCTKANRDYAKARNAIALERYECGDHRKYNAGCRCKDCWEAFCQHLSRHEHGTVARYNSGCRCDECKATYSEYKSEYRKSNEDYRLAGSVNQANRRAEKAGNAGRLSIIDLKRLFEKYPHCLKCGTKEDLSIDHVVPIFKGGSNTYSNLQTLCRPCNRTKRDKIIDYRPETPGNQ